MLSKSLPERDELRQELASLPVEVELNKKTFKIQDYSKLEKLIVFVVKC